MIEGGASGNPARAERTTFWHNAIDRLVAFEARVLGSRTEFEDATVAAVERLVRLLPRSTEDPPAPVPADHESPGALAYFVHSQVRLLRDVAIDRHDYAKRLMIAARPLLREELFADLWLGLRNSGRTPRVRIRRGDPTRLEFAAPTAEERGLAGRRG